MEVLISFVEKLEQQNCPHSNSIVKEMVQENGDGKVLVIKPYWRQILLNGW